MLVKVLKGILLIFVFINFSTKKSEPQEIIVFKINSDTIKSQVYVNQVISFGNNFLKFSKDEVERYIEIRNYTCSFELDKNPLIGFQRAKKVCDILENECHVPRTKIHYIDVPGRDFQILGKRTCEVMLNENTMGIKLEVH